MVNSVKDITTKKSTQQNVQDPSSQKLIQVGPVYNKEKIPEVKQERVTWRRRRRKGNRGQKSKQAQDTIAQRKCQQQIQMYHAQHQDEAQDPVNRAREAQKQVQKLGKKRLI